MTNVVPLGLGGETAQFFEFLYGDGTGYVAAPTLDRTTGEWQEHFFAWPSQKAELAAHTLTAAPTKDVYYSPALLSDRSVNKQFFASAGVAWCEFDGQTPSSDDLAGLPEPSWRIQSSSAGHEHWLWKLDEPVTDCGTIEGINRKLARRLGADATGWDATQVLRAPGTLNHKSGGNKPVTTIERTDSTANVTDFGDLPAVVDTVPVAVVTDRPSWDDLRWSKSWHPDVVEILQKKMQDGQRARAMMRLAYEACEKMNLTDPELYTLLWAADEYWGKYKYRSDRERRLLDIINKVRETHPYYSAVAETPILGVRSLLAREEKIEWLVEGILPARELSIIKGLPASGKTQLSLQFGMHLGVGKDFLDFPVSRAVKTMFFSFEMNIPALKEFMGSIALGYTDEELDLLEQNFKFYPKGYGITLDNKAGQDEFTELVRRVKPEGIFIDSLSTLTDGSLSDESNAKSILNYLARLMAEEGCFVWLIHHNRKPNSDNKKPDEQADAYGSVFISARAAMQINVHRIGNDLELKSNKNRLAKDFDTFRVERYDGLQFRRKTGKESAPLADHLTSLQEKPTFNAKDMF